jgi:LysM repeat protein
MSSERRLARGEACRAVVDSGSTVAGNVSGVGTVRAGLLLGAMLLAAGCGGGSENADATPATSAPTTTTTAVVSTVAPTVPSTSGPTTTVDPTVSLRDPACVATVVSGDSLSKIAAGRDGVTVEDIRKENWLAPDDVIHPDDELDVCIDNDIDDVTGSSRLAPSAAVVSRQQERLNELFASYGLLDLEIDGDSGPLTRQALCAARMGLGLPASTAHMSAGSPEEQALFAADSLSIPDGAAVWSDRWVLIDKTCQVMFTGEADDELVNVYPTSTGEPGFETHTIQALAAFRYDPALDNGGWHDSARFPVTVDNPLNGNMYKPIYFNSGQAIHGANYVPPVPRSKGCARMFRWQMDELISWLGIGGITEPTWRESDIRVTVSVQGDFRPAD